ncbi:hypothetical protein PIB30_056363 [Stylosanthes scabra]|uniref:Uncharacterized protein n=1 Tax=Stylosanthes scabra TaxID=79078 RepID=A0ABU6QJ27_9FABA|nr:hypothetical protein [Stylosanthes scabra]
MANEAHKLGYLRLEDWRLKWVTKVKNNGKLVLGYSMARRKSRVSIELGVQDLENGLLNRFGETPSRLHLQDFVYEGSRQGLELGLRQQRTIGSSKCLWGFSFHMGQKLTSQLTVAAGGPPAIVLATKLGYSQ